MSDKPTTGEWTVKHDNMIYTGEAFVTLIKDDESRERAVTMHNAALAAEQARCYNDGWVEGRKSMNEQLAAEKLGAEVEKVNKLQGELSSEREYKHRVYREIKKLREQLAAEREKAQSDNATERDEAYMTVLREKEQLQQQLAAERENSEKLMTDGISERNWSNHLRVQLAAEVEKVNKLQEQLAAEREKDKKCE